MSSLVVVSGCESTAMTVSLSLSLSLRDAEGMKKNESATGPQHFPAAHPA